MTALARPTRRLLSQLHVNLLELSAYPVFGEDDADDSPGRLPAPQVAELGAQYIAEMHICAGELHREEEGAAGAGAQGAALKAERQRTELDCKQRRVGPLLSEPRPDRAAAGFTHMEEYYRRMLHTFFLKDQTL